MRVLLFMLLVSCGTEPDLPDPPVNARVLTPSEQLVRASMSVRGIRPSVEDFRAVEDDPDALDAIVDGYLESPEFAETVKDLHAELFLLRRDTFEMLPALGDLESYDLGEMYDAQVSEPLKLVEHIVMTDRPYTEIVTADYMFTNQLLSKMYGVPWDSDGPQWQQSWWTDGRPPAGLLSSAEMLRRWESNGSNFNRARANMVASKLLCSSFDTRDIQVAGGIDVADEFAVAHAVKTEPNCVACHQTLDPLAAYFWGYMRVVRRDAVRDAVTADCPEWDYRDGNEPPFGENHLPEFYCYPIRQYAPFAEDDWKKWDLRAPQYFGAEAHDLADLGQRIAEDPRFAQCTARNFYGYFAQVDPMAVPFDIAVDLQAVLTSSGFDAKALVKAVVLHPSLTVDAVPVAQDAAAPVYSLKTVRPEQFARLVEDLTGYRWWSRPDPIGCDVGNINGTQCWGVVDLSTSDLFGFRAMSGGVDGFTVTRALHGFTPTKVLTTEVLAQDAAAFVVDSDFALRREERRLLRLVDPSTIDDASVREQIAWLHVRVLGLDVLADSDDVSLYAQLWKSTFNGRGDTSVAWTVVISTMLQDPAVLFY